MINTAAELSTPTAGLFFHNYIIRSRMGRGLFKVESGLVPQKYYGFFVAIWIYLWTWHPIPLPQNADIYMYSHKEFPLPYDTSHYKCLHLQNHNAQDTNPIHSKIMSTNLETNPDVKTGDS